MNATSEFMLNKFYEYTSPGECVLDEYNSSMANQLQRIVTSTKFALENGSHVAEFQNFRMIGPRDDSSMPSIAECRRTQTTYEVKIVVDVIISQKNGEGDSRVIPNRELFRMPLMLGSKHCELYDMSHVQVLNLKECPADSFGYFIVDGNEKYVNLRRRLRTSMAMVQDDTAKDIRNKNREHTIKANIQSPILNIVCKMTCNKFSGTSQVCVREDRENGNEIIQTDLTLGFYKLDKDIKRQKVKSILNKPVNIFLVLDILATEYERIVEKRILEEKFIILDEMNHEIVDHNTRILQNEKGRYDNIRPRSQASNETNEEYENLKIRIRNRKRKEDGIVNGDRLEREYRDDVDEEDHVRIDGSAYSKDKRMFYEWSKLNVLKKSELLYTYCMSFVPSEYAMRIQQRFRLTKEDYISHFVSDEVGVYDVIRGIDKANEDKTDATLASAILNQFFPVPMIDANDHHKRMAALACMAVRLCEYFAGYRQLDDKNSFETTQIDAAGRSFCSLIAGPYWRERKERYSRDGAPSESLLLEDFNKLTGRIHGYFTSGKWKSSPTKNDIILTSEEMKRESSNSSYFSITRVITKASDEGVQVHVRYFNGSQVGFLCPIHTPDNGKAGLVLYLAIGARISEDRSVAEIKILIREYAERVSAEEGGDKSRISSIYDADYDNKLMINGCFHGWVSDEYYRTAKELLKTNPNYYDVSVVHYKQHRLIEIACDYGRLVRPLMIINPETRRTYVDENVNAKDMSLMEMLQNGMVVWVDATEQSFLYISPEPEVIVVNEMTPEEFTKLTRRRDEIAEKLRTGNGEGLLNLKMKAGRDVIARISTLQKTLTNITNTEEMNSLKERVTKLEDTDFVTKSLNLIMNSESDEANRIKLLNYARSVLSSSRMNVGKAIRATISDFEVKAYTTQDLEYDDVNDDAVRMSLTGDRKNVVDMLKRMAESSNHRTQVMSILSHTPISNNGLNEFRRLIRMSEDEIIIKKLRDDIVELQNGNTLIEMNKAMKQSSLIRSRYMELQEEFKVVSNRLKAYEKYVELNDTKSKSAYFYDHCELSPSMVMGLSMGLVPYGNRAPLTRAIYQCGMNNQIMTPYSSSVHRLDTTSNKLVSSVPPSITTHVGRAMKVDRFPQHSEITIAVVANGYNQEDAIAFKQSSVDRGMFYIWNEKMVTVPLDPGTEHRTPLMTNEKSKIKARMLDEHGVIREGAYVKKGDTLVNLYNTKMNKDVAIKAKVDEIGLVERVEVLSRMILIKLRKINIPEEGNKYVTSPAQKATIAALLSDEDMIFDENGISPDAVISPNSIMGRTTCGTLIQMLAGEYAAMSGDYVDATTFNDYDDRVFSYALIRYGISFNGEREYRNGKTGEVIKCRIFTGISPYSASKHMIKKKIQHRDVGLMDPLTRQPRGGRDGGEEASAQKAGEMEIAALEGHGASMLLKDIIDRSDTSTSLICIKCGTTGYTKNVSPDMQAICRMCDANGDVHSNLGRVVKPYATIMYEQILSAFGFRVVHHTVDRSKPHTYLAIVNDIKSMYKPMTQDFRIYISENQLHRPSVYAKFKSLCQEFLSQYSITDNSLILKFIGIIRDQKLISIHTEINKNTGGKMNIITWL